jgi:UDP-N-acetylmuramyl pentapeptide synthase
MDIEELYSRFTECNGLTTDSRHCPEGSMFLALKGETFNGNAFAAQSLTQGCRYAVVDEPQYASPENPRIFPRSKHEFWRGWLARNGGWKFFGRTEKSTKLPQQ